jgi:phage terminase small subunit
MARRLRNRPKGVPEYRPKALTAAQETFAVRIAAGDSATAAYRFAFPKKRMPMKGFYEAASRCRKIPRVAARIAELRAPVIAAAGVTLQGHLGDLKSLRDGAIGPATDKPNYSAAVAAEIARGKVSGLYVEKHEHAGPGGIPLTPPPRSFDFTRLTDDELATVDALLGKAELRPPPITPI